MKVDYHVRRQALFEILSKRPSSESTAATYAQLKARWSGVGLRMSDLQLCIEELSAAGVLRVTFEHERGDWLIALSPTGLRQLSRDTALFSWGQWPQRLRMRRTRLQARRQWSRLPALVPRTHDRRRAVV